MNMAAAPRWKVYSADGEYLAACKHVEDAAAIVSLRGDGATIRDGHSRAVWTEGAEQTRAYDSYDLVVLTIRERVGA
jgi:hypothetical protein